MAGVLDITQILGYANLCGVIQTVKAGVPEVLPPEFKKLKKKTIGDSGRYTMTQGVRTTARRVEYGSPAIRRDLVQIQRRDVKLLHFFEEIHLSPLTYQNLCAYDSYDRQNEGIEEISRQIQMFKQVFANQRIMATMSMLFQGNIWYDQSGNLLPTSSGAFNTVNYGVPANNQGQLNGIIGASWATATTDIAGHIRSLKQQSLRDTGYELTTALYGKNVPHYFTQNNQGTQYFLARNPQKNEEYLSTGQIPSGMFGIKNWIPAYESFYVDQNSAFQSFVGDDAVTFLPEVSQEMFETLEGTFMVPRTFQPTINPGSPMRDYEMIQGMFAYSVPSHNPPSATIYVGDTFLPVWKIPGALYQSVVAF